METQAGKKGSIMIDSRTSARITGVLFILGTVPMIAAMLLWGQPLSSPDYLSSMAANAVQIRLFALAVMFMGLACAGIGISLYPVLKPRGAGLARAVMGLRLMEGTLQVASAVGIVALLAVSREFAKAGSPADSFFQPVGAAIQAANDWMSSVYVISWCVSAFIYSTVFYRTRLVPRWISVWGFLGLASILASSLAAMLGLLDSSSPLTTLLGLPIIPQEMVLAVWLIAKGYRE